MLICVCFVVFTGRCVLTRGVCFCQQSCDGCNGHTRLEVDDPDAPAPDSGGVSGASDTADPPDWAAPQAGEAELKTAAGHPPAGRLVLVIPTSHVISGRERHPGRTAPHAPTAHHPPTDPTRRDSQLCNK